MSTEVKIPAVGESIATGIIAAWHKQDGEAVSSGDVLLTLETDKISTEIEAETDGVLQIQVAEGEEVAIGQVVGSIAEGKASTPSASTSAPEKTTTQSQEEPSAGPSPVKPKPRISPIANKMAKANDLAIDRLEGSGKGGRITKADVENALQARETSPAKQSTSAEKTSLEVLPKSPDNEKSPPAPPEESRITRQPMTPIRRKIATHLVAAQQNAAILTTFNECDMTSVMNLRRDVQDKFQEKYGFKLGFMSLFVKAVVEALQNVPQINARIDGDDLVLNHYYDIGVAVSTERGLMVPVVRDADQKSVAQIESDILDYSEKARQGKIQLADLRNGVFTISNGGIFGSLLSTPILNPPQSGILGMHKIQERPVVHDGQIVARPMMYLALSYDHRIVDGKEAVTFLIHVKESIENPLRMFVGV